MNQPQMVLEARPISIEAANFIGNICNGQKKWSPLQFGLLIAALSLQNFIIQAVISMHDPGSITGSEMINNLYEQMKNDADLRWQADDLKKNLHLFRDTKLN